MEKLGRTRSSIQGEITERARELNKTRCEELASIAMIDTPQASGMGVTVLDCPRIDGSTSTQPLGMIILCKIFSCSYQWVENEPVRGTWYSRNLDFPASKYEPFPISYSSLPAKYRYYDELALISFRPISIPINKDNKEEERTSIIINRMLNQHAGTHGSYENIINGFSDIGLVARKPSLDELELAKEEQVELDVTPIALDAFVFLKNYKNPVENLSTKQIQYIYSFKERNWKMFGGIEK